MILLPSWWNQCCGMYHEFIRTTEKHGGGVELAFTENSTASKIKQEIRKSMTIYEGIKLAMVLPAVKVNKGLINWDFLVILYSLITNNTSAKMIEAPILLTTEGLCNTHTGSTCTAYFHPESVLLCKKPLHFIHDPKCQWMGDWGKRSTSPSLCSAGIVASSAHPWQLQCWPDRNTLKHSSFSTLEMSNS